MDFFEYYTEDLKDFYYTFDSIQDLQTILNKTVIDDRNCSARAIEAWKGIKGESLSKWKELLVFDASSSTPKE
jgi:hypothetical protein